MRPNAFRHLMCVIVIAVVASACSRQDVDAPKLTNSATSPEQLVQRALDALRLNDAEALNALRVTRLEHDSILGPMTRDSTWNANFDLALAWSMLDMGSQKGVLRAIEDYGGDSLTFLGMHYRDPAETYGSLILHRRPAVSLKSERTGEEFESWMFGTIMELHGQFKFISIRD